MAAYCGDSGVNYKEILPACQSLLGGTLKRETYTLQFLIEFVNKVVYFLRLIVCLFYECERNWGKDQMDSLCKCSSFSCLTKVCGKRITITTITCSTIELYYQKVYFKGQRLINTVLSLKSVFLNFI